MKARWLIVLGLILLSVSCEPFFFSTFPGYLSDATAVADVGALLTGASVQNYNFCVLNNGTNEYAFVLATGFDGSRTLYVFSSGLAFVASFSIPGFGSRHFVGTSGEFVIGGCYLDPDITATSTVNVIGGNSWGSDGQGCVLPYGELDNVFLEAGGPILNAAVFTSAWTTVSPNSSVAIGDGIRGYNLVYTGRLYALSSASPFGTGPASFLGFADWSSWPNQGYLVIYTNMTSTFFNTPPPLLSAGSGRLTVPLGDVASDNTPIFAIRDGMVVRGADGNMRFITWDGQLQATTRDDGASGRVFIDFSPVDFYYVFDPSSLKLYKARDWWQKN
jgi:hypothetical protein